MARGGFTEQELEALNKNKYVLFSTSNIRYRIDLGLMA